MAAAKKRWRTEHPEKARVAAEAQKRKYREASPEKAAEQRAKWAQQKRRWRQDNPEKSKAIQRRSYYKNGDKWKPSENPEKKYSHHRKWQSKNLHKCAAHVAVFMAIKAGKLTKPANCTVCGGGGEIEAHHHKGYDAEHRFDVQWLCTGCHGLATRAEHERRRKP